MEDFGGPKGMIVYCTGTLINNGTISMTARGAKAEGQNVYLFSCRWCRWSWKESRTELGSQQGGARSQNIAGGAGIAGVNRSTGGGRRRMGICLLYF